MRQRLIPLLTLVIGVLIGAFLWGRSPTPPTRKPPPEEPTREDEATPDAPEAPAPHEDEAKLRTPDASPSPIVDASEAPPKAHAPVFREKNLLIRAAQDLHFCVEGALRSEPLWLNACRGKRHQRWTFVEDASGGSRITGEGGACVDIAAPNGRGESLLTLGDCNEGTPRFQAKDDGRLVDAHSGLCVVVRSLEKHATLKVDACNPNAHSGAETWALSP